MERGVVDARSQEEKRSLAAQEGIVGALEDASSHNPEKRKRRERDERPVRAFAPEPQFRDQIMGEGAVEHGLQRAMRGEEGDEERRHEEDACERPGAPRPKRRETQPDAPRPEQEQSGGSRGPQ